MRVKLFLLAGLIIGIQATAYAGQCVLGDPVVVKAPYSFDTWEVTIKPVGESSVPGEDNPCKVTIAGSANMLQENVKQLQNLGRMENDLYPNVHGLRAIKFLVTVMDPERSAFQEFRVRHLQGANYKLIRVNLP